MLPYAVSIKRKAAAQNALRIDGADVTLDGITVDKSAGATSNTENGDFYGVNAALLATNGAQVEFTADGQVLTGDVVVDTISTLNMTLTNGSSFTGTVNIADNAQNGTAVTDNAVVTIDSGCTWTLTGDCLKRTCRKAGPFQSQAHAAQIDGAALQSLAAHHKVGGQSVGDDARLTGPPDLPGGDSGGGQHRLLHGDAESRSITHTVV